MGYNRCKSNMMVSNFFRGARSPPSGGRKGRLGQAGVWMTMICSVAQVVEFRKKMTSQIFRGASPVSAAHDPVPRFGGVTATVQHDLAAKRSPHSFEKMHCRRNPKQPAWICGGDLAEVLRRSRDRHASVGAGSRLGSSKQERHIDARGRSVVERGYPTARR